MQEKNNKKVVKLSQIVEIQFRFIRMCAGAPKLIVHHIQIPSEVVFFLFFLEAC